MTELEPVAPTKPQPDPWAATFERLRARYPRVRDTVLLCVHVLEQGEDAGLDELRARAALHGLHVNGASLNAARRLLRHASTPARSEPARPAPARPPPARPPSATTTSAAHGWPSARAALATEFPKTRDGILYAVNRLRQDPALTLPDIRDAAEAAGVKIGGRSLHSARALLNGRQARKPTPAVEAQRRSVADELRRLVADFEREAGKEVERLRAAVEEAVRVLRAALAT